MTPEEANAEVAAMNKRLAGRGPWLVSCPRCGRRGRMWRSFSCSCGAVIRRADDGHVTTAAPLGRREGMSDGEK